MEIIDRVQEMLNNNTEIVDSNLSELHGRWIEISQNLIYNRDAIWNDHFLKPMEVFLN